MVEGAPLECGQGPLRGSRTAALDISAAPIRNDSIASSSSRPSSSVLYDRYPRRLIGTCPTVLLVFWATKGHLRLAVPASEVACEAQMDGYSSVPHPRYPIS